MLIPVCILFSIFLVTIAIFTLIGSIIMLTNDKDRNIIVSIKREYGYIGAYRMGAVFCAKKWMTLGFKDWSPIGSTLIYGLPACFLQFFLIKTVEDNDRKKQAKWNKLIDKDNGYDR